MDYINKYFIIWAAYNEEKTLEKSFLAAKKAISYYFIKTGNCAVANVIICHNGCTDRTSEIAQNIKDKHSSDTIRIDVLSSPKGMVIAQNASIKYIREQKNNLNDPIIFIDADSFINEQAIHILLEQFIKHPKLKAVGARPVPIPYQGPALIKKIWDKVLNCRAYFPRAEITVNFAPEFHPYADSDPQTIYSEFEKRSKIYFHGRCFALKNQYVWEVPERQIGDDTYLDRSIHYRFGPGSIRTLFDAEVYFYPMTSPRVFIKTFYRIYYDLRILKRTYPQYNQVREYSKTMLDWEYINSLPLKWHIAFRMYNIVRQFCHFLFKYNIIYTKKSGLDVWFYDSKE